MGGIRVLKRSRALLVVHRPWTSSSIAFVKRIIVVYVCVRVPLVVTGILFELFLDVFSRGTVYPTEVTVQRRGFCGGTDITGDVQ